MQAVIIAGGKGTRMGNLGTKVPKFLLPLVSKPLIDYSVEHLVKNGFSSIIICTGHLSNQLEKHIKNKNYGIPISISNESKPLGTAGPLHLIKDKLADEFLVLFGDIYTTINLAKMFQFHKRKKAYATLALHISDHPQDSVVVTIDKKYKLISFIDRPGENWKKYGNLTKTSIYILKKDVINFIAKDQKVDFDDIFPKMQKKRKKLLGYVTEDYVKDIGTPQRYKQVQEYIIKQQLTL